MSKKLKEIYCEKCGSCVKVGYNRLRKAGIVKCQACWNEIEKNKLRSTFVFQEL